jgi:WD40 repeat protein
LSEKGEVITAIAVSPDRHLLAIGERGVKPSVSIYDISSGRKRRTVFASNEGTARDFTSIAFSSDSKYLLAQLGGPDWILHYFAWDKGKLLATVNTAEHNQKILQVSVNPKDGTVLFALGDKLCRMYRYAEGELRSVELEIPYLVFLMLCY